MPMEYVELVNNERDGMLTLVETSEVTALPLIRIAAHNNVHTKYNVNIRRQAIMVRLGDNGGGLQCLQSRPKPNLGL